MHLSVRLHEPGIAALHPRLLQDGVRAVGLRSAAPGVDHLYGRAGHVCELAVSSRVYALRLMPVALPRGSLGVVLVRARHGHRGLIILSAQHGPARICSVCLRHVALRFNIVSPGFHVRWVGSVDEEHGNPGVMFVGSGLRACRELAVAPELWSHGLCLLGLRNGPPWFVLLGTGLHPPRLVAVPKEFCSSRLDAVGLRAGPLRLLAFRVGLCQPRVRPVAQILPQHGLDGVPSQFRPHRFCPLGIRNRPPRIVDVRV
mmetsp:Transcript_36471/g.82440  ORF Transcript_36471/g.82440 Transcript_36471/m.82440 type:complete len:258 (-) Transcript_36471:113-886(-)